MRQQNQQQRAQQRYQQRSHQQDLLKNNGINIGSRRGTSFQLTDSSFSSQTRQIKIIFINFKKIDLEELAGMKLIEEIMEFDQEIQMRQQWINTSLRLLHKLRLAQNINLKGIIFNFILKLQPDYPDKVEAIKSQQFSIFQYCLKQTMLDLIFPFQCRWTVESLSSWSCLKSREMISNQDFENIESSIVAPQAQSSQAAHNISQKQNQSQQNSSNLNETRDIQ